MTSPAIKLAKALQADFTEASGAVTYFFGPDKLETFYTKAQAQALRDAAKWYDEKDRIGDETHAGQDELRRMAEELENQK